VRTTNAAAIFERHHLAVFRYFRRMTGRPDLAQDLSQEVFLRVVRGLEAYQDLGHEVSWLFRIARNVFIDHRRRARDEPVAFSEVEGVTADCRNLVAFGLQEALALLSERDREVFVLRETEGLTYAEIAVACETTEESVKSRLRRARLQLRTLLSGRLSQAPRISNRGRQS
jgi:RNA polymerase sigma factor (sigma-70 family)